MKKSILLVLAVASIFATESIVAKKVTKKKSPQKVEIVDSKDINQVMIFDSESYDFGKINEGIQAEHVFTFVNHGKDPIVVQNARPSCGCTTPKWSKEPIQSGQSGTITAVYNTNNRPGSFNKTITLTTNLGTKVLKIQGNVEPKPKTSAPANSSLIKK